MITVNNPIISGFYPDPSICRVGEDYYLVNSSFAYFPGIPIFHSKNLAEWTQIGNAIDRIEQTHLQTCTVSEGIYAPTIRYHKGVFYIVTTNVPSGGNFIITAKDPAGPWSNAYYLGENAPGIDPSLFFEEDGRCYYIGTRPNSEGERYFGNWEIWIQELDLAKMTLVGKSISIWQGAMRDAIWPEGPHIYKKEGYFFLITAEGGTEYNHSIMVARSKNIIGPYENYSKNPLFTHRHLGMEYPVQCVGHGDMIETGNGDWYLVMLGMRPCKSHTNLGRETFLAKVTWENDWPVINQGVGKLEKKVCLQEKILRCEKIVEEGCLDKDDISVKNMHGFADGKLNHELVSLRGNDFSFSEEERPGWIRIHAACESFEEKKPVSLLAVRQKDYHFCVRTRMDFLEGDDKSRAGLVLFQNETSYLIIYKKIYKEENLLIIETNQNGKSKIIAQTNICNGVLEIKMIANNQEADILFRCDNETEYHIMIQQVDLCPYSTEVAGGFVGCVVGAFVLGMNNDVYADFSHMIYESL